MPAITKIHLLASEHGKFEARAESHGGYHRLEILARSRDGHHEASVTIDGELLEQIRAAIDDVLRAQRAQATRVVVA